MRSLWIPDDGHVLVGVDANALELVMLSCYLYPWDNGAYAKAVLTGRKEDGNDAHTLNMKAAGLLSRDFSKTYFYALIYGAGNAKLGAVYAQDHAENGGQVYPKSAYGAIGKKSRQSIEDGVTGLGNTLYRLSVKRLVSVVIFCYLMAVKPKVLNAQHSTHYSKEQVVFL